MSGAARQLRSLLFVPGTRAERFGKAIDAGADGVILDLEDSVAPGDKDAARDAVGRWLSSHRPVFVRVNGPDTPWFARDLELCTRDGVAGIVIPKAEDALHVAHAAGVRSGIAVLPLIETAHGIWNVEAIARTAGVQRLLFGSIDLALDIDAVEEEGLLYARSRIVLTSRIAGLPPPIDGVCTLLDDPEALRAQALRARGLGFGGKLCIHPRQVAWVHDVFAASPKQVELARRVVAAAEAAAGGATVLDGAMIDRPIAERALATLRGLDRDERRR